MLLWAGCRCKSYFAQKQQSQLLYHSYDPPLRITADYNSLTEALNLFPEQLIQSVLSASNQEWIDYNTLGGEEKSTKKDQAYFYRIATMNKDSNYFVSPAVRIVSIKPST